MLRSLVHCFRIQRLRDAPGSSRIQDQGRATIEDAIAVAAQARREAENRFFQGSLHGGAVRLTLPADESASVVFQSKFVADHAGKTVPRGIAKPRSSSSSDMRRRPGRCTSINRSAPLPLATVSPG